MTSGDDTVDALIAELGTGAEDAEPAPAARGKRRRGAQQRQAAAEEEAAEEEVDEDGGGEEDYEEGDEDQEDGDGDEEEEEDEPEARATPVRCALCAGARARVCVRAWKRQTSSRARLCPIIS